MTLMFILSSCTPQKVISTENDNTSTTKNTSASSESEDSKTTMNKVENNSINATLNCNNISQISLLQLANKKHNTDDFKCTISRNNGLKITWTSESKKLEIIFNIIGIETMMIEKAIFKSKSNNSEKYLSTSLNSKSLGQHNFGDSFEGYLEIIDYGNSSDNICGKFEVMDRKGNKIEGTFNETISMF